MMLNGILGGNHQKWLRQRMGIAVHCDLAFIHRFQKCGLRLWRGAIDFIGQQDVGKNRSGLNSNWLSEAEKTEMPNRLTAACHW